MAKRKESTLKAMENYVKCFKKGMSVREMEELFGLSKNTLYTVLDDIAKMNGMRREELLRYPECGNHKNSPNYVYLQSNRRQSKYSTMQGRRRGGKPLFVLFVRKDGEIEVDGSGEDVLIYTDFEMVENALRKVMLTPDLDRLKMKDMKLLLTLVVYQRSYDEDVANNRDVLTLKIRFEDKQMRVLFENLYYYLYKKVVA